MASHLWTGQVRSGWEARELVVVLLVEEVRVLLLELLKPYHILLSLLGLGHSY